MLNRSSQQPSDDDTLEFETDLGEEEGQETETEGEATPDSNGVLSRVQQLEQAQAMQNLMADPDVRRVIEMKQRGQKVVLADESEETEETPEVDPVEELTAGMKDTDPLKGALKTISALIDKKLGAKLAGVEELTQRLEGVEGVAGAVQKKEISSQVAEARKTFQDFDNYRDQMVKLSGDYPGLNVQELYVLAKTRAGKLKLSSPSTSTERPSNQPRRGVGTGNPNRTNRPKKRPAGRAGFSQMLGEALDKLVIDDSE